MGLEHFRVSADWKKPFLLPRCSRWENSRRSIHQPPSGGFGYQCFSQSLPEGIRKAPWMGLKN